MKYTAADFRKAGITEFSVTCGIGYAKVDSEPYNTLVIDFKQFIGHRDNPLPDPRIGHSFTTTNFSHRICEVGSLEDGMEKMFAVAKAALSPFVK